MYFKMLLSTYIHTHIYIILINTISANYKKKKKIKKKIIFVLVYALCFLTYIHTYIILALHFNLILTTKHNQIYIYINPIRICWFWKCMAAMLFALEIEQHGGLRLSDSTRTHWKVLYIVRTEPTEEVLLLFALSKERYTNKKTTF